MNAELDYETKNAYELIVIATDGGLRDQGQQTTAVVSVAVININDNPPVIEALVFLTADRQPRISEVAQPGQFVARISVSDPDVTDDDSQVNVTLTGGDGLFGLQVQDENVVILIIKFMPDPQDLRPSYPMTIIATDSGNPPLSSYEDFTLLVTDSNTNPPHFSQQLYTEEIVHVLPPGSRVLQVEASDVDYIHMPSQLTYSIQGNSRWFAIDETTGLITTTSTLDCRLESNPRFNVLATDTGSPAMTATATVQINIITTNQNQPLFDQSFYNVSINENIGLNTCILTVSV